MMRLLFLLSLPIALAADEVGTLEVTINLAAELLILFGSFFILAAAIGVFRFPDFYTRLHASTKLVTLGGLGVFVGTAVAFNNVAILDRIVLITLFFFLTAPLSAYMIARSGYLRGLPFYHEEGSVDDWDACGIANKEPQA